MVRRRVKDQDVCGRSKSSAGFITFPAVSVFPGGRKDLAAVYWGDHGINSGPHDGRRHVMLSTGASVSSIPTRSSFALQAHEWRRTVILGPIDLPWRPPGVLSSTLVAAICTEGASRMRRDGRWPMAADDHSRASCLPAVSGWMMSVLGSFPA